MKHYSVLKDELISSLNIKEDGIYVDATLGYAGDAQEILKRIKSGYLFAFDQDLEAVKYSEDVLKKIGDNFQIFNVNFVNMKEKLKDVGLVDGIIFDLGFSSPQIDNEERGFSFMRNGPLDMRMSSEGKSAKEIIDTYSLDELTEVFFQYGEEKMSRVIAKNVNKEKENIKTTLELVEVIKKAVGAKYFYKNHPERKIFQALRIEVNNELKVLESVLPDAIKLLKKGGRLSVITFHSLEDRIVKNTFNKAQGICTCPKDLPYCVCGAVKKVKIINKKPIIANLQEQEENPRSKSAKLRIVEKL